MALNPEFSLIPEKLHDALIANSATKADAATHMTTTGGLTLSTVTVETAIDRIISDLSDQLILSTADYAALLARHQAAPPAAALRELQVSGELMLLEHEKAVAETVVAGAASEWVGLSQAQKDAIPNIKAAGDEGINTLNGRIFWIDDQIEQTNIKRNLGF
jgi:hypothetical protein